MIKPTLINLLLKMSTWLNIKLFVYINYAIIFYIIYNNIIYKWVVYLVRKEKQ